MSEERIPYGPTGHFPSGRLNREDEGELCMSVSNDGGKVFIRFGIAVDWMGMDPQGAADLAVAIIKHARAAASEAGVPVTVTLPA